MHSRRAKQNFFFQLHGRTARYYHAKTCVNAFQGAPLFLSESRALVLSSEILQRNGSETTWAGIEPGGPVNIAVKLVPGLLKPRLM